MHRGGVVGGEAPYVYISSTFKRILIKQITTTPLVISLHTDNMFQYYEELSN